MQEIFAKDFCKKYWREKKICLSYKRLSYIPQVRGQQFLIFRDFSCFRKS